MCLPPSVRQPRTTVFLFSGVLTPAQAFDLEVDIVRHTAGQRRSWVLLAGRLHQFHTEKAWTLRACETFNTWLAQPEVSITRADAYAMIGAWRDLVLDRHVPVEDLEDLDLSKLAVVLPAIRAGKPVAEALADCRTLSRSDLRAEYQPVSGQQDTERCPTCGQTVKAAA